MKNTNQPLEIWKDIPGYEGDYQASNFGRIKSLKFNKEKIRVLTLISSGYYQVMLSKKGKTKAFPVNVLVAMAFLRHVPCGYKKIVDHKDNIKTNNNIKNLQIITQRKNASKDKKNKSSKYTGVSWDRTKNKWASKIMKDGKNVFLGNFKTEKEAYFFYLKAIDSIKNNLPIQKRNYGKSSKYKGVCFNKQANKWQSFVTINGKYKHLGMFRNELEALKCTNNYLKNLTLT